MDIPRMAIIEAKNILHRLLVEQKRLTNDQKWNIRFTLDRLEIALQQMPINKSN